MPIKTAKRNPLVVIGAILAICAFYAWLVYAFVVYVWPHLPLWATLIVFLALATLVIGSPIWGLARMARRMPIGGNSGEGEGKDRR